MLLKQQLYLNKLYWKSKDLAKDRETFSQLVLENVSFPPVFFWNSKYTSYGYEYLLPFNKYVN